MKLQAGGQVPHFEVRTVDGAGFSYDTIWQRRNLLLVVLPPSGGDEYVAELRAREAEIRSLEAECVITCDAIAGVTAPAAILADQWGEIVHVAEASDPSGLPPTDDFLEWLEHIRHRCPECEGEAR